MSSMRSAERMTSSGRKLRMGVFLVRICRAMEAWSRTPVLAEHSDDVLVGIGSVERVEEHDRPVELLIDVDLR